jgi:hypothetical protein
MEMAPTCGPPMSARLRWATITDHNIKRSTEGCNPENYGGIKRNLRPFSETRSQNLIIPSQAVNCAILPDMDILKTLSELREEQRTIEEAIATLERLVSGHTKRRGRPPAWMSALKQTGPKRRGRPPGSQKKPKVENDPNRTNLLRPFLPAIPMGVSPVQLVDKFRTQER